MILSDDVVYKSHNAKLHAESVENDLHPLSTGHKKMKIFIYSIKSISNELITDSIVAPSNSIRKIRHFGMNCH